MLSTSLKPFVCKKTFFCAKIKNVQYMFDANLVKIGLIVWMLLELAKNISHFRKPTFFGSGDDNVDEPKLT